MYPELLGFVVIVAVYLSWKNGFFNSEKYTQIPDNKFGNIENIWYRSNMETMFGSKEGFLNDNSTPDGGDSNLTDTLMRSSLDPSIYESHNTYVKDMGMLAVLPGNVTASVRDDYRPAVVQWGLPRTQPAETIPLSDARQTASEPDSHLAEYARRNTSFKL